MSPRAMTEAEAQVLQAALPPGLTDDMADVALCLFEALVIADPRCGQRALAPDWAAQLQAWAQQCLMQLQHLADQKGGASLYLAKGVAVHLSARDREMCRQFRGDYLSLARRHNLTEMRVRQIVGAWQREQYLARQRSLGLDDDDADPQAA